MRKRTVKPTVRQVNPATFIKKLAHSFVHFVSVRQGLDLPIFLYKEFSHGE